MRYAFSLSFLFLAVVIAQLALIPAFLPPVLRPDLGILVGITILAFAPREFGLISIFFLGLQADLFCSARFGVLTLAYLAAAGAILLVAWRELVRGDMLAPWIGGLTGTLLAHGFYVLIGKPLGVQLAWGQVVTSLVALALSAVVWGLPVAYLTGRWLAWTHCLSPVVRERWANEARMNAARRGKLKRA